MLQPKRVRYRKSMRGRRAGPASGGDYMAFGEYGLQAQGTAWIAARQIEAARRAMTNQMRRGGKIWIRVFPDKPVSKKPLEVRMGSGKGATEFWVAVVKRNRIIFEVAGVSEEMAKEALRRAAHKLPVPTRIVERDELVV